MGSKESQSLPTGRSDMELANQFNDFFTNKIETIRASFVELDPPIDEPVNCMAELWNFSPVTTDDVRRIITKSPSKSCRLDPIPTSVLKDCLDAILPLITCIVNASITTAIVPRDFKTALISPSLKKLNLDFELFKNFRPVSNLSFISKVTERTVDGQLDAHITANGLHEALQSAYKKFHSTETTLLKIQSDVAASLDDGSACILLLLDLSAAFDTIDHDILLNRLETLFC
jgi:hypothetical protein